MTFKPSSSFLALTGFVAMLAQVWLIVVTGTASQSRAALLLVGVGAMVWALSPRPGSASDLERLVVVLAAAAAFWAGALEITLLETVPMARGWLAFLTLAALHTTILYAILSPAPGSATGRLDRGRLARGLLAALTIMLATLTVVETAARALSPVRTYELIPDDPAAGPCLLRAADGRLVGVPGCSGQYIHRDFPGLGVEFNSLGLRDGLDEVTPPDAGAHSVLVLGDSFAYGMGVALEDTFQQVLQARFEDPLAPVDPPVNVPVNVYGAAIPGAGTAHEHTVLRELGTQLAPDAVVVALFQGNDMQDNQAGLERRELPGTTQQRGPISPWRFLASTAGVPFWRTSSSLLQLRRIDGRPTLVLQQAMQETPDPRVEPLRQAMLDELAAIQSTCRELGADLIVLLIPGRVQIDSASFEAFAARHPERQYSRTAFHQGLVSDLAALGVVVVDPLPRLEAEAREGRIAYHPEGHWNRHGHAIAAELLGEALVPLLDARQDTLRDPASPDVDSVTSRADE